MKIVLSFLLLFFFPLAFLLGETEIRMREMDDRLSNIEKKPSSQSMTPCAGPRVCEGLDINLFASFIYWTARLDGLTYAKTGSGNLITQESPKKGEVQSVNWTWDPGFKVGLGWNFCHGCWDMLLQYTWLYTNVGDKKSSSSLQPGFEIRTPGFQSVDIPNFGKAHAHFDLHYQVGDLEIGRNFYVSKTLKLRPFIGAKGTWQKQDFNASYNEIPITILQQQSLFNFKTHADQVIYGIGMRGGINTSWQFFKHLGLYGNLALTGIWLHYNIDRKDRFTQIDTGDKTTTLNIDDRLRLIKPVLEFGMGLRGETYFGCGRYHVLLEAGWESQIWINQTMYISIDNNYDRYDLNLHGLTTKLRFDF